MNEKTGLGLTDMTPEQIAAQTAIKQKEQDDYEKRLAEKRKIREGLSSVGENDPYALPPHLLDSRFKYAIVNDFGNSISKRKSEGWELVTDTRISDAIGLRDKGPVKYPTGLKETQWAYLMRIELELYMEDQERKLKIAQDQYAQLGEPPEGLKFMKNAEVDGVRLQKVNTLD